MAENQYLFAPGPSHNDVIAIFLSQQNLVAGPETNNFMINLRFIWFMTSFVFRRPIDRVAFQTCVD